MRLDFKTRGLAKWGLLAVMSLGALALTGCNPQEETVTNNGPEGPQGVQGPAGYDPVFRQVAASLTDCPNGGWVLQAGPDKNGNGILDDDEVATGVPSCNGVPGDAAGALTGVRAAIAVAQPQDGYFKAGDTITIAVAVTDDNGNPMSEADLNQLLLNINGPRSNVNATKVAYKLLSSSATARGTVNANLTPTNWMNIRAGTGLLGLSHEPGSNIWTFQTGAISDEAPGTYTIGVRAQGLPDADGKLRAQGFALEDIQIKTATVDDLTIERFKCASCHLGANSGKLYLHHIDSGTPNDAALDKANVNGMALLPATGTGGDWARDSNPVRNCKNCHNTDGVAGYNVCAKNGTTGDLVMRDTDIMAGAGGGAANTCPPGYTLQRRADNIVNRVHGIHMGQHRGPGFTPNNTQAKRGLQNPRNIAGGAVPTNGNGNNKRLYVKGVSTYNVKDANGDDIVMANGNFAATNGADYGFVGFPADVRNCEKCHADDSYQQKPSRLACGTCHDNVNFSNAKLDGTFEPAYFTCSDGSTALTTRDRMNRFGYITPEPTCVTGTYSGEIPHPGGIQTDDAACAGCHGPGLPVSVATVHALQDKTAFYAPEMELVNLPERGYYIAGEQPVLKFKFKKTSDGQYIDHTDVANFASMALRISGPRAKKMPYGLAAARAEITAKVGPYDLSTMAGQKIVIDVDGGAGWNPVKASSNGVTATVTLTEANCVTYFLVAACADATAVTAEQVAAWLNANATFASRAVAYTRDVDTGDAAHADTLRIRTKPSYVYTGLRVRSVNANAAADGYAADAAATIGAALFTGGSVALDAWTGDMGTQNTSLIATNVDKVTREADGIVVRLDPIDAPVGTEASLVGVPNGTYVAYLEGDVGGGNATAWNRTYFTATFQVGTKTIEAKTADNCQSCHDYSKRWHATANGQTDSSGRPLDTDVCGSCHDWKQNGSATGTNAAWPNWGFSQQPVVKRVHGLHFGNYLNKPTQVHGNYQINKVIWPQDARNCEKCHASATAKFPTGNQRNVMGVQTGVRDRDATNLAPWANGPFEAGVGVTIDKAVPGLGGTWDYTITGGDFVITNGRHASNPGRLACTACHDTDAAINHTTLMTTDPTPGNPWSGDEVETCTACHGPNRQFAISTQIMNISEPFQFPYLRNPSWRR